MPDITAHRLSSALDARTAETLAGLDDAALGEGLAAMRRQITQLEARRLDRTHVAAGGAAPHITRVLAPTAL